MSLVLERAESEYLWSSAAILLRDTPVLLVGWIKTPDATQNSSLAAINDSGGTNSRLMISIDGAGASAEVRQAGSGGSKAADTSTSPSDDTWHHVAGHLKSDTSRTVWLDGGGSATDTVDAGDTIDLDRFYVGTRWISGLGGFADGLIAEVAMYDTTGLSDAAVAAAVASLAGGAKPEEVLVDELIEHWELTAAKGYTGTNDTVLSAVGAGITFASDHPIARGIALTADLQALLEYSAAVAASRSLPVSAGAQMARAVTLSWSAVAGVARAARAAVESLAGVFATRSLPVAALAQTVARGEVVADYTREQITAETAPVDWLRRVQPDNATVIEWRGVLSVEADAETRLEWLSARYGQGVAPAEWRADVSRDGGVAVDHTAEAAGHAGLRTEWRADVSRDGGVAVDHTAEAAGLGRLRTDWRALFGAAGAAPVEWAGALVVDADAQLPIGWRGALAVGQAIPLQSLRAIVIDAPVPAAFGAGVVSDSAAALEWLAGLGVDADMLAQWGGVITIDGGQLMPIEWGSQAPVFVAGNLNVWHVNARGVVFRVSARGVVWNINR